jgi:hypothetical protein
MMRKKKSLNKQNKRKRLLLKVIKQFLKGLIFIKKYLNLNFQKNQKKELIIMIQNIIEIMNYEQNLKKK